MKKIIIIYLAEFFLLPHILYLKTFYYLIHNFCNSKFKFEIYGHVGSLLGSSHCMDMSSVVDISGVHIVSVVK
jgi:hypothetical protein